ncbi:helix-turn-helix domain-containing protein [Methylobacterium sp. CM6246]
MKRTHKGPLRDVLAKNLRRRRHELDLSQDALAHESGIHRTYVGGVERSERNVSIDNIGRLAAALDMEAWRLLKDE